MKLFDILHAHNVFILANEVSNSFFYPKSFNQSVFDKQPTGAKLKTLERP